MASFRDSIKVGVPIVISVVSLLFGAFQYFDKRRMETSLQEQQLRLNAADLVVYYLDTDLASIQAMRGPDLVSETTQWTEQIEEFLGEQDVQLQETPILLEIANAFEVDGDFRRAQDPQISFLLIRNTGRSNAADVALTYETTDTEGRLSGPNTLDFGFIEVNRAVVVPIGAYEAHTERRLSSQIKPSRLGYTDASTGRAMKIEVRDKLRSPRYVAPRLIRMD